ncbi:DUF2550 domain-containing protein [Hoyosella rhizosphaerae]|nr:DUF2550 domain-containing protein [Hoyosella rhizosphaerae]
MIVGIILLALLATCVAVFLFRLFEIRNGGTGVVVRRLPSGDCQGWRYGVVRYRDESLDFYRLSRLLPGPSLRIDRQAAELETRRQPTPPEFDILAPDSTILTINDGESRYEFALDRGALTAVLAWIESRPPRRARRRSRWT